HAAFQWKNSPRIWIKWVYYTAIQRRVECAFWRTPPHGGAFKKVSEQGRGRPVPVQRHTTHKTRGRGRPHPFLNAPCLSHGNTIERQISVWQRLFDGRTSNSQHPTSVWQHGITLCAQPE